jgi:hypothetical protein
LILRVGIFDEPIWQPLVAGDIIRYWHQMFVCGDQRGRRVARILEVDPELSLPVIVDNGDRLSMMQSVCQVQYVENGVMKDVENPVYRWIEEHELSYSCTKEYAASRKTGEAVRVGELISTLQRTSIETAKACRVPVDLFHGVRQENVTREKEQGEVSCNKSPGTTNADNPKVDDLTGSQESNNTSSTPADNVHGHVHPPEDVYQVHHQSDNDSTTSDTTLDDTDGKAAAESRASEEEDDNISIDTDDLNYHKMVMEGNSNRESLEAVAREGQKKQADAVNRCRTGQQGEVIPKWTICTIQLDGDKNDFTPKHLPVMVCGHYHFTLSNTIRYKICTNKGIIEKTFGREQLVPHPQLSGASMGIVYSKLDMKSTITLTEAGEMYSKLGGKLSYCRCKTDCSKSKQCKCKKLGKFCGQHCHGGSGKNVLCKNCPPN